MTLFEQSFKESRKTRNSQRTTSFPAPDSEIHVTVEDSSSRWQTRRRFLIQSGVREIISTNFEEENLSFAFGFIYVSTDAFAPGYFVDLIGREYREK